MKNLTLTLLSLLLFSTIFLAQEPQFEWVTGFGGTPFNMGRSIAVDSSRNVYVTGEFQDTVDFNPGNGTYYLSSNGYNDVFNSKFDASGDFLWAKTVGGSGMDWGHSIALDTSGNVYTIGSFQDSVDFDPSSGISNLYNNGNSGTFILKLDPTGNFLWAKNLSGNFDVIGNEIILDDEGKIYITGSFNDTTDFDPGIGVYNLIPNGHQDIFVLKLDTAGDLIWVKNMGSNSADIGFSIKVDNEKNVFTTGYFSTYLGPADFDPGSGTYNINGVGSSDIFISKLNSSGDFVWAKSMSGIDTESTYSITLDTAGNICIRVFQRFC